MVLAQIVRWMTLPLLHACWAGVVGWFIATASHRKGSRWPVVVIGILVVATLHTDSMTCSPMASWESGLRWSR